MKNQVSHVLSARFGILLDLRVCDCVTHQSNAIKMKAKKIQNYGNFTLV